MLVLYNVYIHIYIYIYTPYQDDQTMMILFFLNEEQHTFILKRKKKINDSKGISYVKTDKVVNLFEL